jgi:pimeloyl-ACP methyl ester carboxylesterase
MLFGFSRGAQLAHRFAIAYPERTRAVAAMSAGTYTLPRAADAASGARLEFPYGTADLASRTDHPLDDAALNRVPFWISVGGEDNRADDVPRQWDRLLGKTRVQRAAAFTQELSVHGANATLEIFPFVGHAMTPDMIRGATAFMERSAEPAGSGERVLVSQLAY